MNAATVCLVKCSSDIDTGSLNDSLEWIMLVVFKYINVTKIVFVFSLVTASDFFV